jgi:hypothetical protein
MSSTIYEVLYIDTVKVVYDYVCVYLAVYACCAFFTLPYFHTLTNLVAVYWKLYQLKDRNVASFCVLMKKKYGRDTVKKKT